MMTQWSTLMTMIDAIDQTGLYDHHDTEIIGVDGNEHSNDNNKPEQDDKNVPQRSN